MIINDKPESFFYLIPQEKWFSQSSWLDYGRDDTSNKSNTAKSSKTSVSVSRILSYLFWYQNGILNSILYDRQHTRIRQYNDRRLLSDIITYCAILRLKGKCNKLGHSIWSNYHGAMSVAHRLLFVRSTFSTVIDKVQITFHTIYCMNLWHWNW